MMLRNASALARSHPRLLGKTDPGGLGGSPRQRIRPDSGKPRLSGCNGYRLPEIIERLGVEVSTERRAANAFATTNDVPKCRILGRMDFDLRLPRKFSCTRTPIASNALAYARSKKSGPRQMKLLPETGAK
jgi:hypothetical protein